MASIGDPDFDLLRQSFFDVFVGLSGQDVNQSEETHTIITTRPSVPLKFGNHKLLVLSEEATTEVGETSTVVTWTTNLPGTSCVVYDTVSHPVLGFASNYGYANSTATFDENPNKVANHSVSISGLVAGTTYFYRSISSASPESVGGEGSFATDSSDSGDGNGGGQNGGGNPANLTQFIGGQVLGASTTNPPSGGTSGNSREACSTEYIHDYMRIGRPNDPDQVKKLQTFLNDYLGANIPLSGFFGPITHEAVKTLQRNHADEILAPREPFGGRIDPTGYVFKMTKWFINKQVCGDLAHPSLP